MKGKEKCKILKEIRAEIAKANDIKWVTENCTHKGDCRGTCPKCESEVRALERELERRRMLGKTVVLAGVSASLLVSTMGCDELLYDMNTPDGMMVEPDQTTTRTKRTTTTMQPLSGEPEQEIYISLSDYHCINEITLVANRGLYLEFVSDIGYAEGVKAHIAKDEVFTLIAATSYEGGYLVRRSDGVILSLYYLDPEDATVIKPAPDFEGEGMTYGGISYLVQDFTPVEEKIYSVVDPFDIMQLYNRAYTEEKQERLESTAVFTLVGESKNSQTSLIRLEDGSLFAVENHKISAYAIPVISITLTK